MGSLEAEGLEGWGWLESMASLFFSFLLGGLGFLGLGMEGVLGLKVNTRARVRLKIGRAHV